MNYGDSAVKLARVASGKSQEKTAAVLNISLPTYAARERLPRSFSVEDLVVLKNSFNDQGKEIIDDFIKEIFLL